MNADVRVRSRITSESGGGNGVDGGEVYLASLFSGLSWTTESIRSASSVTTSILSGIIRTTIVTSLILRRGRRSVLCSAQMQAFGLQPPQCRRAEHTQGLRWLVSCTVSRHLPGSTPVVFAVLFRNKGQLDWAWKIALFCRW